VAFGESLFLRKVLVPVLVRRLHHHFQISSTSSLLYLLHLSPSPPPQVPLKLWVALQLVLAGKEGEGGEEEEGREGEERGEEREGEKRKKEEPV